MSTKHSLARPFLPVMLCLLAVGSLLLCTVTGCGFGKLKKDVEELATLGLISGTVTAPGGTEDVHVLLFTETEQGLKIPL